ncbi:copper amine oxidase N-terminal domain-containing protein [Paenibacillus anaericanus]|uniref:Copper amine oxidase N-terminal domain-containing protein n=1 Tax=Paenibacillus anaericanus TaxID=170367 RepID=A0A433XVK1_9BACL|nr:copper amine oxidase N-terminal domain-containing protein [Paenibacillus anaericanus]RUT38694.1 copper amine oxidase N-terminal domain-containing protein [Paenibacillus anaericanus]
MKKGLVGLLMSIVIGFVAAVSSPLTAGAAPVKTVTVEVDGKAVVFPDAKPYMEGSRVLIPVRFVSEALGAEVKYSNKTVVITKDGKTISMKVNTNTVTVDGKDITLDVPVRVKQNRTFVPLRFVSEALEAKVVWSSKTLLVSITTKEASEPGTGEDPGTPPVNPEQSVEFKWGKYTDLGSALFKNNVTVKDGNLKFTVPANAQAVWYTSANGNGEELKAGKSYTKSLGKGQGYLMITQIYPGKDYVEGYAIYLDVNDGTLNGAYSGLIDDGVVSTTLVVNGNMVETSAPLLEVINSAKQLK